MGVLNLSPDSFSGDGLGKDVQRAVELALRLQADGADLIDVGGESTRPPGRFYGVGSTPVSAQEEIRLVLPVIERLKEVLSIPISIDTYKSDVAYRAVVAGAAAINDVWGLKKDPDIASIAAETNVPLILTHNQETTEYTDIISEVTNGLRKSIQVALERGAVLDQLVIDPGIGFGKTPEGNLEILRRLDEFRSELLRPVMVGTSRKSTIGLVTGVLAPEERVEGTAATVALAISKQVDMIRVHDVRSMCRVARMSDAIVRGWSDRNL
jgi:dihydropteroate synthase